MTNNWRCVFSLFSHCWGGGRGASEWAGGCQSGPHCWRGLSEVRVFLGSVCTVLLQMEIVHL